VNSHRVPPGAPRTISVVIPTLNEAEGIEATIQSLSGMPGILEIIAVDGGSTDETRRLASQCGARVVAAARGRGLQMHVGARAAVGDVLWFLHADTLPPPGAAAEILRALAAPGIVGGGFAVRFSGQSRAARFFTAAYPWMCRLGFMYGDAGLFVRASSYEEIGGFRPIPVFEDLSLVRRLRRQGRVVRLPGPVVTSSRRFEGRGGARIVLQWAVLHLLYAAGVSPHVLGRLYPPIRESRRD
jgi:rSAM/selenodomain-associated transferase 2